MKLHLLALLLGALPAAAQQQNSGIIEYEMTSRLDASNIKVVRMGPGGSAVADDTPMPDLPDLITMKQVLTFAGGKGKLETEGLSGGQVMSFARTIAAGAAEGPGNTVAGVAAPGGNVKTTTLRPPISNTLYIDLANRKFLNVTQEKTDSAVKATWYTEEDYKQGAQFKTSGKTKTIAGYNCKRATVKVGEENFVVWYTEDIPVSFSPVNGVMPEKGVVLAIESTKRSYVAKKVTLKPIPEAEVGLPADAQKVTAEELKENRRQILEKFHNEQFEKFRAQ